MSEEITPYGTDHDHQVNDGEMYELDQSEYIKLFDYYMNSVLKSLLEKHSLAQLNDENGRIAMAKLAGDIVDAIIIERMERLN